MATVAPQDLALLSKQLQNGERTPKESVERALERLREVDGSVLSFLGENGRGERVRAAVEEIEHEYSGVGELPPLYGVPVGVKDIFNVGGLETRAGSQLPASAFSGEEATAVRRLKTVGAVVLGKTVTTEFAYFSPGPTGNPWNLAHTPGGSSSGSAAAVAAGIVPLALGTQTIGSITRPASFCGIVGFKPSYGRIPVDGVVPFSPTVDHVGVFVAGVTSARIAAAGLCDEWDGAAGHAPGGDLPVLGVLEDAYSAQADESARGAVSDAAECLGEAGYTVLPVEVFEDIETINALHNDLIAREFSDVHAAWYSKYGALYSSKSCELYEKGLAVSDERADLARKEIGNARSRVEETMRRAGVSLLLSPSTVGEAPKGLAATGSPIMNLPWTFCGVPTVTLPVGAGPNGLPLGLQIAAGMNADEHLIACAEAIQAQLSRLWP